MLYVNLSLLQLAQSPGMRNPVFRGKNMLNYANRDRIRPIALDAWINLWPLGAFAPHRQF